jgi:hypothetical protein
MQRPLSGTVALRGSRLITMIIRFGKAAPSERSAAW